MESADQNQPVSEPYPLDSVPAKIRTEDAEGVDSEKKRWTHASTVKAITAAVLIFSFVMYLLPRIVGAHPGISTAVSCTGLSSRDLATHMNSQVDDRLGSLASTTSLALWTTRATTATSGPWVRNTNVWTSNGSDDLDFTGVSPYKVDTISPNIYSYQQAGTLISPRHLVMAYHYRLPVGAKVIFVNNSNVAYERTVASSTRIVGPAGNTDLSIALLDADVPDSITYYPVIASTTLIEKTQQYDYGIPDFPIISLNQQDQALVNQHRGYSGVAGVASFLGGFIHAAYTNNTSASSSIVNFEKKKEFSGSMADGDSGDANFLVIGGNLVYMGPHTSVSSAYFIGEYISEINAVMTAQGGGYQLTELDVSCFNDLTVNHAPVAASISGSYQDAVTTLDSDPETGEFQVDENVYFDTFDNPFYKFTMQDSDGHGIRLDSSSFPANYFSIGTSSNTYAITLSQPLSRSNPPDAYYPGWPAYLATLQLSDTGVPAATVTYYMAFAIKDNNRPLFSAGAYAYSIVENSAAGTAIGSVSAELQDPGDSLAYSLVTNPSNAFAISAATGQITVADASFLNYEATTSVNLIVQASAALGVSRSASPTLQAQAATSTARVAINLTNVDETPTPPVLSGGLPSGALSTGTTGATLSVTTNESSTCKYGTTASTAYASIANTFGTTGGTTHTQDITGLSDGNSYAYYVRCADGAGSPNLSDYTVSFSVASAVDSAAPVLSAGSPSTALTAGTTGTTLSVMTSENATCKYGTTPGLAYASMANVFGTTGGTTHTQSLTGLSNGTSYAYYARCVDGSSNLNSSDYVISFSIAAAVDSTGGGGGGGGGGGSGSSGGSTAIIYYPAATSAAAVINPAANAIPQPAATTCLAGQIFSTVTGLRCTAWSGAASAQQANTSIASDAPSVTAYVFTRSLNSGMTGGDVRALQRILNALGYVVAATGVGSPGNEGTYFGPATKNALIRYQSAKGISPPSGLFGPLTRASIAAAASQNPASTLLVSAGPAPAAVPAANASVFARFVSTLRLGSRGAEVKMLRTILRKLKYLDPYGGAETPANSSAESDFFGQTTETVVKKFQCDYSIICSGTADSTGYGAVGPKTRAILNGLPIQL